MGIITRKNKSKFLNKKKTKLAYHIFSLIQNTGLKYNKETCSVHWVAKIAISCFLCTYMLQIIALVMARDDPERLFECFSVISFCGMGILKLISLRFNNKQWSLVLIQMLKLENEEIDANENKTSIEYESDDEERQVSFESHIGAYTSKFNTTSFILSKIYWFTAVIFILSPFVEYSLKISQGIEDAPLPHVLPCWSPLDCLSIPGYLITVVCELFAAVYCVCVHVTFDLTAVGVMTFTCGQYALLRDYSECIGGRGKAFNISKKRDLRARFRVKKCHGIQILLNRIISTLDKLLNTMLGVYFFVATLTLCSVALRLKKEKMSIMQLMTLLQYMCATLTQLFLYCNYGNAVHYESSVGMGEGPLCAAYWCLSPKLRQELLLLIISMMQVHRLHAGPFNSLDLPSFVQIVRAAYSYYAVLT